MFRGLMSVTSDCIWVEKTRLLGGDGPKVLPWAVQCD
jgi:hypothetical protein